MADRDLPDELIEMIRKHLDLGTNIYVTQFRAVCQYWRSSIPSLSPREPPPQDPLLPSRFYIRSGSFTTIKRSVVYHIAPSTHDDDANERKRGWLIRLDAEQKLRPPLSWSNGALEKPRVINTVDFGVLEAAKPYLLASNYDKNYHKLAVSLNLDVFPAVMLVRDGVLYLGKWSGGGVEVKEYSVQLSPSDPDDDDDPSCSKTIKANDYDDVIFYQGKFCAVSQSGKLAAMDSSFKWKVIAFPVSTSMWWKKEKKKNLVESLGELLLVERHGSTFVAKHCSVEDMLKNEVKFKVYKLDGVRKQWVEMKGSDLDDRILFVGEDCCFSVSTRDFPGCQGNCIYFSYEVWCGKNVISSRIGVFHLDVGRVTTRSQC